MKNPAIGKIDTTSLFYACVLNSDIWPEKELFCRNWTIEDVFVGLVHCTQYGASFHLQPTKSFHAVTEIFGSPEPCTGPRCLWCMPVAVECYLGNEIPIIRQIDSYEYLYILNSLPSPSGRSMLYSGMHSRNSSSISTAFFSVNLTQQMRWINSLLLLTERFVNCNWNTMNLANSCRGLLPLVLAASADTLRTFDYQKETSTEMSHLLSVRSTLAVFMWPSFT